MTATSYTRRPFVVGLTGGIGSGKSRAASLFAALGVDIVDADVESHRLSAPRGAAIELIRQRFGAAFIAPDGSLDRARMRERVYADPAARRQLEGILHPLIAQACEARLGEARGPYAMLVIPLLVESGRAAERVQRILVVDCAEQTQIDRVMQRDQLSEATVRKILAAQATRAQRLAAADDVLSNEGLQGDLAATVHSLHARYLQLAKTFSPMSQ